MKRRLACLVLLAGLASCAGPPSSAPSYTPGDAPAAVAAPAVQAGDYWEYAVRDGYTELARGHYRYEVTRADDRDIVVQVVHEGRLMDTLVFAPGWNGREMPLPNTQRLRYEPDYPAYDYPLVPGKSWRKVVRSTDVATGRSYRTYVYARVIGWERIRVPAGEFDALKIHRFVFAGNSEGWTSQEEIEEMEWYAPSVRRAVRTQSLSEHFDTSRGGGGEGGGEFPLRVRGDFLIGELARYRQ